MQHETVPKSYKEYPDTVMSNCDHKVEQGIVEILQEERRWSAYPGYNFWGAVWWNRRRKKWSCMVLKYHDHVNTIHANTPEELMQEVSNEYGYD